MLLGGEALQRCDYHSSKITSGLSR